MEIRVTNTGRAPVFRGGYQFEPGTTTEATVNEIALKEIRACSPLRIAAPEQQHVCEVCGFTAKTAGGLRFHKMAHDKKKGGKA